MTSDIAESRPPEFLSIKYLGEIVGGADDTTSERVRARAPAFENYSLAEVAGGTEIQVALDVSSEYEQLMQEAWPEALAILKSLCEGETK